MSDKRASSVVGAPFDMERILARCPSFAMMMAVLLVLLAQAGFSTQAHAQTQFSAVKSLCTGTPGPYDPLNDPAQCPAAPVVAISAPVYYLFTVTNLPGQPTRNIVLQDQFTDFVQNGAAFCRDSAGASVPLSGSSAPNAVGEFALGLNQTVICFVPGHFTATGPKANIVTVSAKDGGSTTAQFNTKVTTPAPLNADLSVTKMVAPTSINVTSGAVTVLYTVMIKNNGPAAIDIGGTFQLHDDFRLRPNSVPLRVSLLAGATCMRSVSTTQCLDPLGPVAISSQPMLVGTMAPHPLFDWGFAASGGPGHIDAGATLTLTYSVKIEKLPFFTCTSDPLADGLRNTVFFMLANPNGTAQTELNPLNNTAFVDLPVATGGTVIPNCGAGQLKITKTRITPQPSTGFSWTTQPFIEYAITIQNVSMPPQSIAITGGNLQDWVTEGINTPPFTRTSLTALCSSGPACTSFNGGGGAALAMPFHHVYYGQAARAWLNKPTAGFTLTATGAGSQVVFRTRLKYDQPDCETVPNANPKLIINTGTIHYVATPVGIPTGSQAYDGASSVTAAMAPQPPCSFIVKKALLNPDQKVKFGVPLIYKVTFTNAGAARTIGTVADLARITNPAYAIGLPFTSSWSCSGPIGNLRATGTLSSGAVAFQQTPAHGSPTVNLRNNPALPLAFPAGATLTCTITINVQRPAFNGPFCTSDPAQFENLGLMDVTFPYNPNPIAWPPGISGVYNPALASNPTPQNRNWASTRHPLPKCFDAVINKTATVVELPSQSAPWTFSGPGAPDVHYSVNVTDTAQSTLTGTGTVAPGPWNGLLVNDTFTSPYTNANAGADGLPCPGVLPNTGWCSLGALGTWNSSIGAASIGSMQTLPWHFRYPGLNVTSASPITNCARLTPSGSFTGPDWYSNYNPAAALPNAQNACVSVPVLQTTSVNMVKKTLNPQGGILPNAGPFTVRLDCAPYMIPVASYQMSTGANGTSPVQGVIHVPVAPVSANESCAVSEPNYAATPIPASPVPLCPPGRTAAWAPPVILPASFTPIATPASVTVTNQVKCQFTTAVREISFFKQVKSNMQPVPSFGAFTILTNCDDPSVPASVALSNGVPVLVQVHLGAVCAPSEPIFPPPPIIPGKICTWDPVDFAPQPPFTVTANTPARVVVTNSLRCL